MIEHLIEGMVQLLKISKSAESNTRLKILLLLCENEKLTISQIQQKIKKQGESFNYRSIWQHVQRMQGHAVKIEKLTHQAGQPVYVSLSKLIAENKKDFIKYLKRELKDEKKKN